MAIQETAKAAGRAGGKYFSKLFGFFFLFVFIVIPLLYAITISVQAGSVEPGFSYIAPKLVAPVQQLEIQSEIAIVQEGTYVRTGHFFGDIWNFLTFYYFLIGSIYVIFKWNKVFYKIMPFTPWSSNDSNKMVNVVLAISVFIILQMIFLGALAAADPNLGYWEAVNTPFRAVKTFVQAFPFFIAEANSIIDWENNVTAETALINDTLVNMTNQSIINATLPDVSQGSYIIH